MKVCGFTFVRNALKYDYPVVESIKSILPLCDEFIVAVGNSEDDTLNLIKSIDASKIKIIETIWDDSLRSGGQVLAIETNKAFSKIPDNYDWAFYIQADEVVHEKYHDEIYNQMKKCNDLKKIEGLLFRYQHFYGSYDYVADAYRFYRNEIRIIRNNKNFFSYRDAQGFRKGKNEKLNAMAIDAEVYHYGWVKPPKIMQNKQESIHKYWHDDHWIETNILKADEFDYSNIDALRLFKGSHPKIMQERIEQKNWKFDYDLSRGNLSFKDKIKRFVENHTGYRIGEFRNYRLVK